MSHAEFLRLSRTLVAEEIARPAVFRRRLWLHVIGLHAAVIFLALLPLLAGAAVLISGKWQGTMIAALGVVAIIVSLTLGMILWGSLVAMLSAPMPIPQGLDLGRNEAPGLFAELDALCRRMRVAPFDGVLLSADCNAQVTTGPRPGRQGLRRYLVLGVPLMQGLSAEEMKAVLAHELAHRGDRRPLVRAVERGQRWLMNLQKAGPGMTAPRAHGIFDAPLAWFEPRWQALVLIFRRRIELQADAAGAAVVSKDAMAAALARLVVLNGLFADWSDAVGREARQFQHSPADLPERWGAAIAGAEAEKAQRSLDRARRETRRPTATHPTLSERWSALGAQPIESPLPPPNVSSWEAWLGEARAAVTKKFATWWAASAEGFWQNQRNRLQHSESVRHEPEPAPDATPEEREQWTWDQACAVLALEGKEAARPFFEAVLALNPRHEGAGQWLVRERLQAEDATAIELLRTLPPVVGAEELWLEVAAFHGRAGRAEDEWKACAEADAAVRRLASLHAQCGPLRRGDVIRPHTLAPEYVALLAERAAVLPLIARVAAVRKELRAKPGEVFHLIAVQTSGAKGAQQHVCAQQLAQAMQTARLPGMWRIVPVGGLLNSFNRVVFTVPGARIYDRRHATR
jgi:Zn-dependent protease with chaperone function